MKKVFISLSTIMFSKHSLLLLGFLLSILNIGYTQNDQMVYLQLKNGNTVIGKQLRETDTTISIESEGLGVLDIEKSSIKKFKKIDISNIKNGKFWLENPNSTRYLFGPSGYALKAGEGYYQNFMLFYNSVGFGLTDQLTMGAGVIPFTFGEDPFFTAQAKYAFPIVENKWNFGAGALFSSGFGDKLGIGYGVLTYGSKENNLTIGAGYGWTDGDIANRPIITISAMTRLGRKFGFVTENWLIPQYDNKYDIVYSFSFRFIGDNVSLDFGIVPIDGYPIPLLGVLLPFGNH